MLLGGKFISLRLFSHEKRKSKRVEKCLLVRQHGNMMIGLARVGTFI